MKRKKTVTDELGVFNILLIGGCSTAISVADNIRAKFQDDEVRNPCNFNIISDIDSSIESNTWFNEFIFEISTTTGKFNNIIVSEKFKEWMLSPMAYPKRLYMKKLLQAMNVVIVDVSLDDDDCIFDYDTSCAFVEWKEHSVYWGCVWLLVWEVLQEHHSRRQDAVRCSNPLRRVLLFDSGSRPRVA